MRSRNSEAVLKALGEGLERANKKAISHAARVSKKDFEETCIQMTCVLFSFCQVQTLRVLPNELSQPGGELGPTLKLKRFFVYKKYEALIDDMYKS